MNRSSYLYLLMQKKEIYLKKQTLWTYFSKKNPGFAAAVATNPGMK